MTIRDKLTKYQNYVQGETQSQEVNTEKKRKQRLTEKHTLCDKLILDAKPLTLTPYEKQRVHFLIDKFTNFKELHGNAKKEQIILSFVFFIKMTTEVNLDISRCQIAKKHNLNHRTFETIICRIGDQYMQDAPLPLISTTEYDHEILSRHGGKP